MHDLEAILKKNNWNRSQLKHHLKVWNKLGANGSKIVKRSREEIIRSLQGNCDTAAEVLKKTWESCDVVALLP
jgi:predicted glycosyltransferase involved in capsule biosynthesis